MDKREKVLDGLTKCELYGQTLQRCLEQECPYVEQRGKTGECVHFLHEDAVELLRALLFQVALVDGVYRDYSFDWAVVRAQKIVRILTITARSGGSGIRSRQTNSGRQRHGQPEQ